MPASKRQQKSEEHPPDEKHPLHSPKTKSKWMNERATGCCQYNPTLLEHYANVVTHAAVIVPSIIGAYYLYSYSKNHAQSRSSLIYGMSLVLLFSVSTVFHIFSMMSSRYSKVRKFFHCCDRATIYVFIASSYTPWLYLRNTNSAVGEYMISIVWTAAFLGILYQLIFYEKYKLLEIVFYISVGFVPSIVVLDMDDWTGLSELATGGAFYVLGVVFFKSDGIIPFAHAIWHLFVCLGASVHYYAIMTHLFK